MGAKHGKGEGTMKSDVNAGVLDSQMDLLLKHTHFTREEIIEQHEKYLNEISKGKLTQKVFIEIYKNYYPNGKIEKYCEYIFKSKKDDQLDFVEYLIAISVITRGTWREKLKMSFEIFDLDKNGTIDQEEMKGILEAVYEISGADRQGENSPTVRVKHIMKQFDKNNDGILNIDEFISGCIQDPNLRTLFAPIIK